MKKIILLAAAIAMALPMQVMADEAATSSRSETLIWAEEFDKLDTENLWTKASMVGKSSVTVEDGWLVMNAIDDENPEENLTDNNGRAQITTKDGAINKDISNYPKIEVEMKVEVLDTCVPEGHNSATVDSWSFPNISGTNSNGETGKGFFDIAWYWGRFVPYTGNGTQQLYPTAFNVMPLNIPMTIRAEYDIPKGTVQWSVYKEGTERPVASQNWSMQNADIEKITKVDINLPENWKARIDYIRIKAIGLNIESVKTDSGAAITKKVRTDAGLDVTFNTPVTNDSLSSITVEDKAGNIVDTEITQDADNDKLYHIYFPAGLKYNTKYTLSFGAGITNDKEETLNPTEMNFTTEASNFTTTVTYPTKTSDKIVTQIKAVNNTGAVRKVEIVTVFYAKGKLVKIDHRTADCKVSSSGVTYKLESNVTGLGVTKYETYIWDSFEGMHKIEE